MPYKMKIIARILMIVCLFLQTGNTAFAQGKRLLIAGDPEKEGGYLVEITRRAFEVAGYTPEFVFVPWARALIKSTEGEYDVLLAAYYTEERAEKLLYSKPIGKTEVFLLKLKNRNINYKTIADLKPYRIGHIRNSKVSPEFDEAEKNYLDIEYVHNTEQNIKKLLAGRIDLVVEKRERIDQLLNTTFRKDAHKLELVYPPLNTNYFHNCVSRKKPDHEQIIADFNKGLKMIRDDGTRKNILEKYGISLE